ncbi:MAG TPA: gliding motility-associated C-terminal domain-containing protein [Chitinophagaceae bacterium]|nr:gliding motility-associated C-terminal domain-containing protein [Chitinophagaceae bacterium]
MRSALVLLMLLLPGLALADTFTVTSNADSGPGTLREALQKAIDNGSAVTDHINFSLPYSDISSITITLQSQLPIISSNLVIDGTTQPSPALGTSNAQVKITVAPSLLNGQFTCFYIYKTSNIEIYGLYFDATDGTTLPNQYLEAIRLFGSGDVIIGKPGKGNVIKGWGSGIVSSGFYHGEFDESYLKAIKIQSNFFGLNTDGELDAAHNISSIATGATDTVIIGGATKAEGNYLTADRNVVSVLLAQDSKNSLVQVQNNTFNTNVKGTQSFSLPYSFMLGVDGTNSSDSNPDNYKTFISNNLFGGTQGFCGIGLTNLLHKVKIFANKFGDEINSSVYVSDFWVTVFDCTNQVVIGDADEHLKNTFTKGRTAIRVSKADRVLITKDSFYCNVVPINNFDTLDWKHKSFIAIHGNSNSVIQGTALPSAKIEVFINHDCVSTDASLPYQCQGKHYIGSFNADGQGKWMYNNPTNLPLVFTATKDSSTSDFSNTIVDNANLQATGSICDKPNGSIKGINVISGVNWFWENSNGDVVGNNLNLLNVPAGTYSLHVSQGNIGCEQRYYYVVDSNPKPKIDTATITIIPASCGVGGSVYGTKTYSYQWSYNWLDSNHSYLQSVYDLQTPVENLQPGRYYLNLVLAGYPDCATNYGPFVVTKTAGPSFNTSGVTITRSTCGKSNGAITNITYRNTAGNVFVAWEDDAGNTAGAALDLTNVPAGRYRLKLKDGENCDTVFTQYFTIKDTGSITFDVSHIQVTPSSCKGATGSITKITSTNTDTYTWVNAADGSTVGNAEDINNLPAGNYQLKFANNGGCSAATSIITVKQQGFLDDTITKEIVSDPNCGEFNGFVKPLLFTRDTSLYTFEWRDSSGNLLTTNTAVYNLKPGYYTLYATDPNGCKQAIFNTPLIMHPKPVFNYDNILVKADTCKTGSGAVQGLATQEKPLNYTWTWYNGAGQQIGNSAAGITGLGAGNYYATITDEFNCTVTSNPFTVNNYVLTLVLPQAADQYVKRGSTATLTVTNIQPGLYYLFDTVRAPVPVATSPTGVFTTPPVLYDKAFFIQDNLGSCSSNLAIVWVKIYDSSALSIPNAFSPNGDGINDTWHMKVQGTITSYNLTVFNRYGQSVFTTTDINKQWDGTLNGKPLPTATYYYVIKYSDNFSRPGILKGFVVILR